MSDHFDDLPQRPSEHVGEDESRQRVRDHFKDPYFIVRGESENDYGVDIVIEAINTAGSPTNFRAHAQLKASGTEPNQDGSYSYPIARTNLNYLLNHPSSVYLFLARDTGRLLYRTAESILEEREAAGPEWHTQKTLTVRFSDAVDEDAVRGLRDDIIRLNRYLRSFRTGLVTQAVSLESRVAFDPSTGTVTDLGAVTNLLAERGLALVAGGYHDAVGRMLAQLSEGDRTGDIWLVSAYLSYSRGLVYDAANDSDRARTMSLSTPDKSALADYVSATARFAQGHIDTAELEARLSKIEANQPTSVSALYSKMDRLQREVVRGDDATIAEIESVAESLRGRGASFEPMSIQADTLCLQERYFRVLRKYIELVTSSRVTYAMGLDGITLPVRAQQAERLVQEMFTILQAFKEIFQRAQASDPRLLAEAIYAFELCKLQERMFFEKTAPKDPNLAHQEKKMTEASVDRLRSAASLFEQASLPDAALRARMLEVDTLWAGGRRDEARQLAGNLAKVAAQLGLGGVAARAMDVFAGSSPLDAWDQIPAPD